MEKPTICIESLIEGEENLLLDAQFFIEQVMRSKQIDRTRLAAAMGVSKARLSQLLGPDANPTVKSLGRVFAALGEKVTFAKSTEANKEWLGEPETGKATAVDLTDNMSDFAVGFLRRRETRTCNDNFALSSIDHTVDCAA